jgi:membrane fusion protein (multidrug efflux system)
MRSSAAGNSGVFGPLALAAVLVCGPAAFAQAPLPAVGVITVPIEDVSPSSEFVGPVEAVNAVDIRARGEGFVEQRPFAEGQAVREWQDLFIIEDGRRRSRRSGKRLRDRAG